MTNYSDSLFSYQGSEPALIPTRLRLTSGQTRYSTNITIDELNELGYTGPFSLPSVPNTQKVQWNPTESRWDIIEKTSLELAQEQNKVIRDSISFILSSAVDVNDPALSDEALKIYSEYYAKLNSLLNSTSLLTNADVPTLELPQIIYKAELERIKEEEIQKMLTENLDNWKYMYEVYGISGWETSRCMNPEVEKRFVRPSDWVASGTIV